MPHMVLVIDAQQCYNRTGSENSDTGDSRNHLPEPSQNADTAVTVREIESSQTVDNIDSASTSDSKASKELADPVRQLAVPFRNGADPVERFVTALSLGGQTTRGAGTGSNTEHRRARMSLF